MADFCLATRMSPSEYRKLTVLEFFAFIEAVNDRGPTIEDMF